MAATKSTNQGKSGFVKEFLNDHPKSNPAAVIEAWQAAGMDGTISPSLINKIRSELGLAGNLRRKTRGKGKPAGRRPGRKPLTVAVVQARKLGVSSRGRQVNEVEAELDRLLFKVMGVGNLPGVEEGLRETRRALYRHLNGSKA
jgi:hypothetical protein